MGGKRSLLSCINTLAPTWYSRFLDVFGGSGTVLLGRPLYRGCLEVYNDYNHDLTNLFFCVKERTLALLLELGFLPLNSRDEFEAAVRFLNKVEFDSEYLREELELAEVYLPPPEAEELRALLLEQAGLGGGRRPITGLSD